MFVGISIAYPALIVVHLCQSYVIVRNIFTLDRYKRRGLAEVRRRIRDREVLMVLIFLGIVLVIGIFLGLMICFSRGSVYVGDNSAFYLTAVLYKAFTIVLFVLFVPIEIILIQRLIFTVMRFLNYDLNDVKFFKILAISNVILYSIVIICEIFKMLGFLWEAGLISSREYPLRESPYFEIFNILDLINGYLPLIFAYLNMRNVSYKHYF